MANLSDLSTVITDMFGVIKTIISEMVTLLTGDLLVLAIVGSFVALIVGIISLLLGYVRKQFGTSVSMKK